MLCVLRLVHAVTVVTCGIFFELRWRGMIIIRRSRVRLGVRRGRRRQWRGQGDGIRRMRTVR